MSSIDPTHSSCVFLFVEVEIGITLSDIALTEVTLGDAADDTKIIRDTENARTAYDTVLRFKDGVMMDESAAGALAIGLDRLRTNLRQLGESV